MRTPHQTLPPFALALGLLVATGATGHAAPTVHTAILLPDRTLTSFGALTGPGGAAQGLAPITLPSGGTPDPSTGRINGLSSTLFAPGVTISLNPASGVYQGDVSSVTRSPFRDEFGDAEDTRYLNARASGEDADGGPPGGSITITFSTPQDDLALLWGSVDPANPATWNTLNFFNSSGVNVGTITGADVFSMLGSPEPPAFLPGTSNAFVEIKGFGIEGFTRVVATAGQEAFEFTLLRLNGGDPFEVSAPASLALLGAGLLGLGLAVRRNERRREGALAGA